MNKPSLINETLEKLQVRIKELETKEKELLRLLRLHESLHLKVLNALPINIFLEDRKGRTIFANEQTCRMNGRKLEDLVGKTVFDFFPPAVAKNQREFDLDVWRKRELITKEVKVDFLGQDIHMLAGKTIIHLNESNEDYMLGFGLDITDRVNAEEMVSYMAYHDALTELPNRWSAEKYLENYIEKDSSQRKMLGVLLLDLDRFKVINDSLGHQAGDLLLKEVAKRLEACKGREKVITRIGGDEFLLLIPNIEVQEDALSICAEILRIMEEPFDILGQKFNVTTSIGCSLYPNHGSDLNALIKSADLAMYHSKELGRNCYSLFSTAMNDFAIERMDKEILLRQALENNEFVLYYQPKIDVKSGKIYGVEALIRWKKNDQIIYPDSFISVLEETGLIVPVGEWVMREACQQCKMWHDEGLDYLSVSVNLSPQQFRKQNLEEKIQTILFETGLPPYALELELTESTIMQEPEQASVILTNLKALGIKISIDDFGTGFSSLSYLKQFPIDILKIDKSFVMNLERDDANATIASVVVSLAHNLKLKVVAEGIETVEQFYFLKDKNCDYGQGYLFSPPVKKEEALKLMQAQYQLT